MSSIKSRHQASSKASNGRVHHISDTTLSQDKVSEISFISEDVQEPTPEKQVAEQAPYIQPDHGPMINYIQANAFDAESDNEDLNLDPMVDLHEHTHNELSFNSDIINRISAN